MTHKPKTRGYLDRAALAAAIRATNKLIEHGQTLIDEGPAMSRLRHSEVMLQFSINLAALRSALAEMQQIREDE